MRLPLTLTLYIGRHFFFSILVAVLVISAIVGLVDLVELIRRSSNAGNVPFSAILQMMLLKMPQQTEIILPFAVLIGAMFALMRLTKSHELVVARATGMSVWQFLTPAVIVVLGIGTFSVMVFNPLSAVMAMKYDQIEGRYLNGRASQLAVTASGLWLRQQEINNPEVKEYFIHAQRVSQQDMSLSQVIMFVFGEDYQFVKRLDADRALLRQSGDNNSPGHWEFSDAVLSVPGAPPQLHDRYILPTYISMEQIQESFSTPDTISFWELPAFIAMLEKAGFSALAHKMHWLALLASPFMMCAMVFIAAAFSLRLHRRGGIGALVVAGLLTGFVVHLMTNFIQAYGLSGSLPLLLSAWAPAVICIFFGMAALLHLEDG